MKIALKASNGYWVAAEGGGGIDPRLDRHVVALSANRTEIGPWETFEVEQIDPSHVALKTCDGFYVTAEGGGGSYVRTDSKEVGIWETFGYVQIGATVSLVTCDGLHMVGVTKTPAVDARHVWQGFSVQVLEGPKPVPTPVDRRFMKASYCSHRDHENQVVFDPIYFGVWWDRGDRARLDSCLNVKRGLGVTAVQLCVQGGYGSYMGGATFDFRGNPAKYGELCTYIRDEGFTPVILVATADGGTHVEIYNGQMQRVLEATAHLAKESWYCAGYEQDLDRGGAYSARQQHDAALLMRRVCGTDALLGLWLQPMRCTMAAYWGSNKAGKPSTPEWNPVELTWVTSESNPSEGAWIEADDPAGGGEPEAWHIEGGKEIDGLFYQTDHGANGPSYAHPGGTPGLDGHGQPRYYDRLIEICDRFLPRGTPMPGANGFIDTSGYTHTGTCPSHSAPDWFAGHDRPRGRPVLCLFETVPYEYSRNQCCDEAVQTCSQAAISLGISSHGCWQPG